MIDKLKKNECCGCNVCGDVCPKSAITFVEDNEGFLNPVIDHEKCIDCGLCDKVCPSINADRLKKNDFEKPICFGAVNNNLEVRFDSTSGGAFSALAKKAYLQHYYVGGAIWNEDWSVSHFISNKKSDLERLRSSKYIQSDARGFYKKVKKLLDSDEKVLLCGTPCQIAGLKSYLRKDYEKLVTIDFICQYVNSPLIWHKYIEQLEKEHQSKVIYIKDKNKELGWRSLCNKVVFENGDVLYDRHQTNSFRRCYMYLGIASRPSCYECKFKGFPRIADITIADFWGVEKYLTKEFDGNLGTSLIMCNSQKGLDYFDENVKKYLKVTPVELEMTLKGNAALTVPFHPYVPFDRNQFYDDLEKMDIKTVVDSYIEKYRSSRIPFRVKRKIKNVAHFWWRILRSSNWHIGTFCKNIWYNFLCRHVEANILEGHYLVLYPHCLVEFKKGSKLRLGGTVVVGLNYHTHERKDTKFLLMDDALIDIQGEYSFFSGCDIQVFKNAKFIVEGGGDTNMNVEIVCGKEIRFQKHVFLGRNIIIRDTNGEHYISRQGYKTLKPVTIGTHAWICDRATIMPGVHVHPGGIVGACSYVVNDVPAFSLVSGNPAIVVDEDVYWKS